MLYLGIDIGTSSLKMTVMNANKKAIFENAYDYKYEERQEGYREIDPNIWFHVMSEGIKRMPLSIEKKEIEYIGITGQMHTTVILDADGQPLRPAIMWNDTRASNIVKDLKEELSNIEETKYIAKIISAGCPASSLLWMKINEPQLYSKINKVICAKDYIVYKLTNRFSTDYCDASTSSLYDIVNKKWSSYMINKLEISNTIFAPIFASSEVVGTLLPSLSKEMGLNGNVKIIAGTGDNPATAISTGILETKTPILSLGTSGVIIVPKEDMDFDGKGKNVLLSIDNSMYMNVVQGAIQSAGGTHRWWVKNILKTDNMGVDQELIDISKLGSNQVLFFPHLSGDKTVYADQDIKGMFLGIGTNTKREDMTQAVFEGVGFAVKELLDEILKNKKLTRLRVNGGGSKSPLWMQILANILNLEIEVITKESTPSYGVCLLAWRANQKDEFTFDTQEKDNKTYTPKKTSNILYQKQYTKYKKLYSALKIIE